MQINVIFSLYSPLWSHYLVFLEIPWRIYIITISFSAISFIEVYCLFLIVFLVINCLKTNEYDDDDNNDKNNDDDDGDKVYDNNNNNNNLKINN